ncbi:hypothetical protein WR25_23544 isoform D [Diploscapter pachys]|uniref:Disease resistance R13L4/SHOC-2-like LRR domain-containing protein n=1 Tax=Diploscapter pachys TaxID=2018661 RepID=A0A2A2LIC0_9BILA|nr:hypothetical protein WR25_23544 isoform D [Diploscapter pachys]
MFLNRSQILSIFIAQLCFPLTYAKPKKVEGCPNLGDLESQNEVSAAQLNSLILCFCEELENSEAEVSFLYGSNVTHLEKAGDAIKKANLKLTKINMQHMEFPATGMPDFVKFAPNLRDLNIRECANQEEVKISPTTFDGLEGSLKNLSIYSCNIPIIPPSISKLVNLEQLDLGKNKIEKIPKEPIETLQKLKYLDLSGNFISKADDDSLGSLKNLETLVIGEHNYFNETLEAEIGKLKGLKTLDMSRCDGIFEPPMSLFNEIPQLEVLKLSGCSIGGLEPGAFAVLKNLEQLDLRVNLIENVSAFSFDGLEKLKKLSIAGNYIHEINDGLWEGLKSVEELDIGWNEIKQVPEGAFKSIGSTLKTLNLRHNPVVSMNNTGAGNLATLTLSECGLTSLNSDLFKEYKKLESLEVSHCNVSKVEPNAFENQKDTLKSLKIMKNKITSLPNTVLNDLPLLEELDTSENPFQCDSELTNFISAVEQRHKTAANEKKEFLFSNANATICDRPYKLHGKLLMELDTSTLEEYDPDSDTTTVPPTTDKPPPEIESGTTTPFKIPDLNIGANTNDSLFKEEPKRKVYDLNGTDDTSLDGGQCERQIFEFPENPIFSTLRYTHHNWSYCACIAHCYCCSCIVYLEA